MKNSRRVLAAIGIPACIVVLLCVWFLRQEQAPTDTGAAPTDIPNQAIHTPANSGDDIGKTLTALQDTPEFQPPKTHPANSMWLLTPGESIAASPPPRANHEPHDHPAVVVADLDTRPAAGSLPTVKAGDDIELALPNGEITRARVNLVQNDNGVLRLGGSLPDKDRGSFALALNAQSQLMGMILLRDIELAYTIEPGERPGHSRMEASALSDVICHPYEDPPEPPGGQAPDTQAVAAFADGSAVAAYVPTLSSRPAAPAVLYLEFNGATVTDPYWNSGNTIVAAAANLTEAQITEIWKGVAEAYSPFNIDVTTDPARYSAMPAGKRMRCIITPTYQWYTNSTGTRGVALLNSFARAGGLFASDTPCWIFVPSWYSYIPLVTAHELGHTLGLRHDGLTSANPTGTMEYFGGHGGSGTMSWGPIMGNPSYRSINQWSKGEYAYANNSEDDIAIIANATNGFGFHNDGIGKNRATATAITIPATGNTTRQGVIATGAEEAWFTFTLAAGRTISLAAASADITPKLDITLQLQNAAGNVLLTDNPSLSLDALIETTLPAGTYYLKLQGASYSNGLLEGYPRYGSVGQYTLACAPATAVLPPTITQHPQTKSATTEDASFTLSATATGAGTLRYQWQKNGADLASDATHPNVTSSTLTIYSPTVLDAGQYTVTVRNAGGATTSNAATVTITAPPPPVITSQPQNATAIESYTYSVNFSVSATGAGSFSYQWQKDGVNINNISGKYSGVTSSYFQIYYPVPSDNGKYRVIVSNKGGSTPSAEATLAVTPPPPPVITAQPDGVARIEGDSSWSYGSVSLTVSASSVTTMSYQWQKDGVDIVADSRITGATSRTLSISKYVVADSGNYTVIINNAGGSVTSSAATVTIHPPSSPPIFTGQLNDITAIASGNSITFYSNASGQALNYQWQKDGVDIPGAQSSTYSIYSPQASHEGVYTVIVWNSSGTITSNPATLTVKLPEAPLITMQPSPLCFTEGASAHMEANISSQSSYTSQWYKNGIPIPGATSTYYNITAATPSHSGIYTLTVTNPGGSTTSDETSVQVTPAIAPSFVVHPEPQKTYSRGRITFTAIAEGNPAPAIAWYKNGAKLTATGPRLTIDNIQPGDTDTYAAIATNIAGSATSNPATATAILPETGDALHIQPAQKHIGPARVVYQIQVATNAHWNLTTDATWLAFSKNEGYFTDTIEVTAAPNPLPIPRTAIITIANARHTITQAPSGVPFRELWAVGSNTHGQLGDNAILQTGIPLFVGNDIKAVASGGTHTLILKNDGTLWTVGSNTHGQLGTGNFSSLTIPVKIADNVTAIAASPSWSVYIKNDNTLWGMGQNASGQLNQGDTSYYNHTPVQIASNVKSVATGAAHLLYIALDNTLWAVGNNYYGQLGNDSATSLSASAQIATNVKTVAASNNTTAFIKTDNTLWMCGHNEYGIFGDGSTPSYSTPNPTPRQTATNVHAVSLGTHHSLILKTDATLHASGYNYDGQLGTGNTANKNTFTLVATGVTQIAAAGYTTLYLTTDRVLHAAGANPYNMLPGMTTADILTPAPILQDVQSLAAASNGCLFIYMAESVLYACGNDSDGQLATGMSAARQRATPMQIDLNVASSSAGATHTMYIKTDHTLWAAGDNQYSKLGLPSFPSTSTPVNIATKVATTAAGATHSLYIKTNGMLYGIGHNYDRQIGSSSHYAPHLVSDVNSWTSVATDAATLALGAAHTLFIKTDSSLWGMGSAGALSQSTGFYDNFYTPRQMTPDVTAIAAGSSHTLYIKSDATLWGRGYNNNSQLAQPSSGQYAPLQPVQIADAVKTVAAAASHTLWIDLDGTLWAVGNNSSGQLASSTTTTNIATPTPIATSVKTVSTSPRSTHYITDDNRLWAVGNNSTGKFGNGTLDGTTTPIPVAANIAEVSAGDNHTLFIATGDIRLDPPPPPVITSFTPASIVAQTKVVITGSNFDNCAGVYFENIPADQFVVDSPTQITAYAPVIPIGDNGHIHVGTFDGIATSTATYSASYAPIISEQIPNQFVHLGSTISLDPLALGTPDPTITWQIFTNNGATWNTLPIDAYHSVDANGVLKIANIALALDGHRYRFIATNAHGDVTSQAFALTVVFQPVVMAQPVSKTVNVGASVAFTADIEGAPPPTLQWQISTNGGVSWDNIAGATAAIHTIAAATTAMNGCQYRCVATNSEGATTTNPAILTVQWAPIENNPITSQTAIIGNTVTLTADINANPAPGSYQWQVSTNGGSTWTNLANGSGITGATAATLQIAGATAAMNGYRYRCIVTNNVGSITTQPMTLSTINSPFVTPSGLFIASGTLYVSDADAHTIYRVALDTNKATLLAGATGVSGTTNATSGANARFNSPTGLAITKHDNRLYVLDTGNNGLRRVTMTGTVSSAYTTNDFGNATGITVTPNNTLFIAQTNRHAIIRIYYTGTSYLLGTISGKLGTPGSWDSYGTNTTYNKPSALAVVPGASAFVVADTGNHTIRTVRYYYGELLTPSYFDTYTLAGVAGQSGSLDGAGTAAQFNAPAGIAATASDIYVADTGNHTIRRIDNSDNVTTIAGVADLAGFADGTGTNTRFNTPTALALDASYQNLYIADSANSVIRKLNLATREVTTLAITATGASVPSPVITAHPQNITATQGVGGPLVLTFTATGQGSLTSQWQKNGVNITASSHYVISANSLSIHNHTTDDSGQYRVIVSNAGGSTPSNAATVTVNAGSGDSSGGGGGGGALSPLWLAALLGLAAMRMAKPRLLSLRKHTGA